MRKLIVLLFLVQSYVSFAQTAWVREKNELFASVGTQYSSATKYFSPEGSLVITTPFYSGGLFLYSEYGFTKAITGIVNMPVFKYQGYQTTNTVLGIGDVSLGVKVGLLQDILPISISSEVELPSGTAELLAVNQINKFETINLPTGDGELNIHNKVAVSYSLFPKPVYFSAFVDFNYRTAYKDIDFRNQIASGFEFGFQSESNIYFIGKLNLLSTLGDSIVNADFSRGEGTSYTYMQIESVIPIGSEWSVSGRIGFYSDLLVDRKNIYASPVFGIGLAYKGVLFK